MAKNDYDYKGWSKEFKKDPKDHKGHFPDKYKRPNHIIFSTDSIYNTPEQTGGVWTKKDRIWYFKPSKYNLSLYSKLDYIKYFERYEPNAKLVWD